MFEPTFEKKELAIKSIKNFISEFQRMISGIFPLESEEEKRLNDEEIDAMILRLIYDKVFMIVVSDQRNKLFNQNIRFLKFLKPENLELNSQKMNSQTLKLAAEGFNKIKLVRNPKDKLILIVNSCKIIGGMITHHSDKKECGADDFLPSLIYCIIQTNLCDAFSEISFIQLFNETFLSI